MSSFNPVPIRNSQSLRRCTGFRQLVRHLLIGVGLLSGCNSGSDTDRVDLSLVNPPVNAIEVTGSGFSVSPEFDPAVLRYALRAPEAETTVQLTIDRQPGVQLMVQDQPLEGSVVQVPLPAPGEVVRVAPADTSQADSAYEFVVLPNDFPVVRITTLTDAVAAGDLYVTAVNDVSYVTALDNNGVPTYLYPSATRVSTFMQHANEQRSFSQRFVAESGLTTNRRVLLDQSFDEVARLETAPPLMHTDSHDFLILPNGNHVFLAYEPAIHNGIFYEDSVIQEVDPVTGEEVFSWNSWEQIPLADQLWPDPSDYAHINSVSLDTDGNFLASLRGTSQIIKVSRSDRTVMWKLGGLSNEFTINDPLGGPCGQHHVTRLASGNILLFDNGVFCPDSYPERPESARSRVVEYALDEENRVADLVWSYRPDAANAPTGGSAQRLANGNTLIGWGGRAADHSATEVDPQGNVVFEMDIFRDGTLAGSNRVLRY